MHYEQLTLIKTRKNIKRISARHFSLSQRRRGITEKSAKYPYELSNERIVRLFRSHERNEAIVKFVTPVLLYACRVVSVWTLGWVWRVSENEIEKEEEQSTTSIKAFCQYYRVTGEG